MFALHVEGAVHVGAQLEKVDRGSVICSVLPLQDKHCAPLPTAMQKLGGAS